MTDDSSGFKILAIPAWHILWWAFKLDSSYRFSLASFFVQFCFFSILFPSVNPKGTPY